MYFIEAIFMSIGTQGKSIPHIAWYDLLRFMVSAIYKLLEHLRNQFHNTKSLSLIYGGGIIQILQAQMCQLNHTENTCYFICCI